MQTMKEGNSPSTEVSETNATKRSAPTHQEVSMNSKFAKKYAVLFYCAMLLVVTASASGQAGKLDPTFGIGGITTMRNVVTGNTNFFAIGAVAVQSDGKIVVAGGVPGTPGFTVHVVFRFLPT